jgi:hypothetical protein
MNKRSILAGASGFLGQSLERSARAVLQYQLSVGGEFAGSLSDFLFDDETWETRYFAVEQRIEQKKLHLQSVERFTWATERVLLRNLQPVKLAAEQRVPAVAA